MYHVSILEQYFAVADDRIDDFRAEVLGAVRDGGGFVSFELGTGGRTEVLITPHTSLRIERAAEDPHEDRVRSDAAQERADQGDVDWWLEWG